AGSWYLHQLLADEPLDFFVLFSSAASVLGQRGQGNYAAASAFLDAFAHLRREQGLPALSVDWPPWNDLGFAVTDGGRRLIRRLAQAGLGTLPPGQGLALLAELMGRDTADAVVLPVDRQALGRMDAAVGLPRLLTRLMHDHGAESPSGGGR